MKQRLITGIILVLLVLLCLLKAPYDLFFIIVALVFGLGAKEWAQFINPANSSLKTVFMVVFLTLAFSIWMLTKLKVNTFALLYLGYSFAIITASWWLVASYLVVTYPKNISYWSKNGVLKTLFGFLTLFPAFFSLVFIKTYPALGNKAIIYILIIVCVTDSGAYFVGRKLGKTKLIPKVSPNKTLEGLLGGLFLTCLTSLAIYYFYKGSAFVSEFSSIKSFIIITVTTATASVMGDLSESMFKREANIKDSGNILPGHGGILDRIDSVTCAFPIFVILYMLMEMY